MERILRPARNLGARQLFPEGLGSKSQTEKQAGWPVLGAGEQGVRDELRWVEHKLYSTEVWEVIKSELAALGSGQQVLYLEGEV
jgi:hypothetical protein